MAVTKIDRKKQRHSVALAMMLLIAFLGCKGHNTARYNPYQGSLSDLLPKQVGNFTFQSLHQRKSPAELAQRRERLAKELNVTLAEEIRAEYRTPDGTAMFLKLQSFSSSHDAFSFAVTVFQKGSVEEKVIDGNIVGKRFESRDGDTVVWTDGSLVCQIDLSLLEGTNLEQVTRELGKEAAKQKIAAVSHEFERQLPF